tara:strand:+ start:508 stop:1461 length:954 start_codon:yes stop_codon:yes gene_type:complete
MKRVLICGATGFIGKNLVERFSKKGGFQVRAVHFNSSPSYSGDNIEWVRADLRDSQDVKKIMEGVDVVLQYAATTTGAKDIVSKPYIHVTDNAVMNSLLLREAFEQGVGHFVMPSCTVMYKPSETPLKEEDFNENDEMFHAYYGAGNTKVYLEKMCKFYANLGKTKHTVLRQSNIYGAHDKYDLDKSHVFGATITKVMTSDDKVVVWGTGEEQRDFLYVEDLLDLVELSVDNQLEDYTLINASFGSSISIADLVKTIVKVSEKPLGIEYDSSKPSINTKLAIDNSLAKEVLGWEPKYKLQEGIKKTITWYTKNVLDG